MFGSAVLWNGFIRVVLFWLLGGLGLIALAGVTPYSDWQLVFDVLQGVAHGDVGRVTDKDFAFALSSGIVQLALALAFAFLIAHVALLRAALFAARWELRNVNDLKSFAAKFDGVSERIRRNAVLRHAWGEFEKTIVREDSAIRNTVRPQAFINLADARERLLGIKMMGAIPGFFVGLGLLLTFIGLVLALNNAAGSTQAGSADDMKIALSALLAAATFKFSTSIAGLGASLVLSLLIRMYQIWIEGAFDTFARKLEERMLFYPAQRIAAESRDILAAQRDELKQINSEAFFTRLGQSVAPRMEGAVSAALRPVTEALDSTLVQLRQTSQSGVNEMLQGFLEALRGGAGVEMTQVTRSLEVVRAAIESVQRDLAGSGAAFAQQVSDASENISRRVQDGVGEMITGLQDEVSRLAEALQVVSRAFASQTQQIDAVSARSRDTADAFGRIADDVRSASEPLLAHSESLAASTERMATSIAKSTDVLVATEDNARAVADQLSAHLEQIRQVWDQYEARFKGVDEDLGKAADRFHDEVERHQEATRNFVAEIDKHTESILSKIGNTLNGLTEEVAVLSEAVVTLRRTITPHQQAAE